MTTIRREITFQTRVLDAKQGMVRYTASDESLDSYREIIRARGWRFNYAKGGMPLVDSHDYSTIRNQVGSVVNMFVEDGKALVNDARWAIDVPENTLAQLGWKMTAAGYLNRVSVGFHPIKMVAAYDGNPAAYNAEIAALGLADAEHKPRAIYLEQEQVELSVVVLGANYNAIARAYKAGVLADPDLDYFSTEKSRLNSRSAAIDAARAADHRARLKQRILDQIESLTKKI